MEERIYEAGVRQAQHLHDRRMEELARAGERRESFLEEQDARMEEIRSRYDDYLAQRRAQLDARIADRRERIEAAFVGEDAEKKQRFEERKKRTDRVIANKRKRRDHRIKKHRAYVTKKRREHDRRTEQFYEDARLRETNRLNNRKRDTKNRETKKRRLILLATGVGIAAAFFVVELALPGTFLKRRQIVDDTPLAATLAATLEEKGVTPTFFEMKEYDLLTDRTQEQLLWDLLMEHYNGNKVAVLGVMCNLHAESAFEAGNLEDYNNRLWDVTDGEYTEGVNRKTINKKDFLEARTLDLTNGFLNEDNEWVNRDGGYGYAQYTAYDKKEGLYQFAEQWFGPGGPGENYLFNIGDPKMQAHFIVHLLETDELHELDDLIRHAEVPVDACYYWLKMYEEPYDPYCDDYYTLAFERVKVAEEIEERCGGAQGV